MKLIKKTGWRNNESLQRHIESRNEANNQYDEFPFISKYCFITPGSHSIYRWMSKEGLLNWMQFVTVTQKRLQSPHRVGKEQVSFPSHHSRKFHLPLPSFLNLEFPPSLKSLHLLESRLTPMSYSYVSVFPFQDPTLEHFQSWTILHSLFLHG